MVQWDCAVEWECRSSTGLHSPPVKALGLILAVCRINLCPAVRMELGQEGWLKQLVAKDRGPIMSGDQGSRQGHQCSETVLTGDSNSRSVWVHPRDANRCPHRREANCWPTGSVRLCSSVRTQELHKTANVAFKAFQRLWENLPMLLAWNRFTNCLSIPFHYIWEPSSGN